MCPQCCLVYGICDVDGADPEEHDNAINRSKADETTKSKDTVQRELVLPGTLEVPDHWYRESENDEVHYDIEYLVDDNELIAVEAFAVDRVVPVGPQWAALETTCDEDGSAP